MKWWWIISFVGIIGLGTGCEQQGWQRLSEREVRRLLPKYMLLTSSLEYFQRPDSIRQAAYDAFFTSEGYSTADWDSTIAWYAKHDIGLLSDMYRQVGDSLTRQRDYLQAHFQLNQAQQDYASAKAGYVLDSVNLLNIGEEIYYGGNLINQFVEIAPSASYSNVDLELSARIFGLPVIDSRDTIQMGLYLVSSDSTMFEHRAIDADGWHRLRISVPMAKRVQRVRVLLRGVLPKSLPKGFVWLDSLRLIRYPKGSGIHVEGDTEVSDIAGLSVSNQEWAESKVL